MIEQLILVLYASILIAAAFRSKAHISKSDYLLASQQLGLPLFVATLVATWYGGVLGVVDLAYDSGLVAWTSQGWVWYACYLFFALFLVKRIRTRSAESMGDYFAKWYGPRAKLWAGFLSALSVFPAAYLLGMVQLFEIFFQIPKIWAIFLSVMITYIIVYRRGLHSVAVSDGVQFIFMFGGVLLLLGILYFKYGPWWNLDLPTSHLAWKGNWSFAQIFSWFLIASASLVDPNFYQRTFAAKSTRVAVLGVLLAIVCWFIFDFCTSSFGLYSRALFPNIDGVQAFFQVLQTSSGPIVRGFIILSLFACVLSTLDSYALTCSIHLGHDVFGLFLKRKTYNELGLLRFCLVLVLLLSAMVAWRAESIVQIWFQTGTLYVSAFLVPGLAPWFPKLFPWIKDQPEFGLLGSFMGFAVAVIAILLKLEIPPIFLGTGFCLIWFISGFWVVSKRFTPS